MTVATYPGPDTIHRHILDNGITVLIYENTSSNTVAIEGVVRAGAVVEPAAQAGLADFTADLLIRGSSKWTFEGIAEALESVGAGVSFGGGRHTTGFSTYSLVEDLDLVLDIAADARYTPPSVASPKLNSIPLRTCRGVSSPACVTRSGPRRWCVSAPFS